MSLVDDQTSLDAGIIAVDVGGMSFRSGVVRSDQSVVDVTSISIDHGGTADALITSLLRSIRSAGPTAGSRVAIAIPGPFDYDRGISLMEHKFAALRGLDLRETLTRALDTAAICFVNDAAAAGAGEVLAAGAPPGRTLVLTLGTGLGASLFDGAALRAVSNGIEISELWSTPLEPGQLADDRFSARGLAAALGVEPTELPTAARSGPDQVFASWGVELGRFVESMRQRLDIDRVIFGGGASGAFDRFAAAVATATDVPTAQARLGSSGPLLGAASLAFGIS